MLIQGPNYMDGKEPLVKRPKLVHHIDKAVNIASTA